MKRSTSLLLLTGLFDETGFRISQIAIPLIALSQTGSSWTAGLVAGSAGIPVVLAPWWTRRVRQRLTTSHHLVMLHIVEAAILAVIPLAITTETTTPALLCVVGLGRGVAAALLMPARSSLLADIGDRDGPNGGARLLAWDDAQTRLALVMGPPIGAVLWTIDITVAALGPVVASTLAAGLLTATPRQRSTSSSTAAPSIRQAIAGQPTIMAGWCIRGTGCLCWFAFGLGLPVLGADNGAGFAAAALAAYGVGGMGAAYAATRLVSTSHPLTYAAAGWTVCGISYAAIGLQPTTIVAVTAALVAGTATPIANACISAIVVRHTAGPERRAALAGQRTLITATSTCGTLIGSTLFAVLGIRTTIVAAGIVVALAAPLIALYAQTRRTQTSRCRVNHHG